MSEHTKRKVVDETQGSDDYTHPPREDPVPWRLDRTAEDPRLVVVEEALRKLVAPLKPAVFQRIDQAKAMLLL